MATVKFGWFEVTETNGQTKATVVDSYSYLPCSWQILQPPGIYGEAQIERDYYSYEGYIPLENTAAVAVLADLNAKGLWSVVCSLWVPCPIHPAGSNQRRCEYPALWLEPSVITNTKGCATHFCEGCWHSNGSIYSDPGDYDEFLEMLSTWSKLKVVPEMDVAPHEDYYEYAQTHNVLR